MELSSLQHLDDRISFGWSSSCSVSLDGDVRHSWGSPGSSFIDIYPDDHSFIDMYPAELFTQRCITAAASDFDFDRPRPVVTDGATAPPMLLVSASLIFRGGVLLPCEPGSAVQDHGNGENVVLSSVQEHGDGEDVAPNVSQWPDTLSPMFDSSRFTAGSCSGAMSNAGSNLGRRQRPVCTCGSSSSSSPWKVLSNYLRFLVPLYRKVRALRQKTRVVAPAVASLTRGPTSSSSTTKRCHGKADTAVDDAILYCKKSSGQAVLPD